MQKKRYELIIPVAKSDISTVIESVPYIKANLMPSRISIISNKEVQGIIESRYSGEEVYFVDENSMLPDLNFAAVKDFMKEHNAEKRTGWYFQQFLKMGYCFVATEDYYMSWDADTVPLKEIKMFTDEGAPFFSIKKEYNEDYFDTIKKLLGCDKQIKDSFIAEHMMFNTEIMKELIQKIANNDNRNSWFINILLAVSKEALPHAGFSEFETYGTYVVLNHPDVYKFKDVVALRTAKRIFGNLPKEDVMLWLAKHYQTASFEKWDEQFIDLKVHNNALFRRIVPPVLYVKLVNFLYSICPRKNV